MNQENLAKDSQEESNATTDWQLINAKTMREVHDQLIDVFSNTYHQAFEDEWMGVNHNLNVELRSLKFEDGWVTGFLLTPWMLSNIFIPVMKPPEIQIDKEWLADARENQAYVVIGPLKKFALGDVEKKANLNFDKRIGHYLLQPLVQTMDKYSDNAQAFGAWSEVIKIREEYYAKKQQELELKQELQAKTDENGNQVASRRSLLTKWQ